MYVCGIPEKPSDGKHAGGRNEDTVSGGGRPPGLGQGPVGAKDGYQERKELFYGYVDEYALEFRSDDTPCIRVNGLDGLAFTAGIGENDEGVREEVIRNLSYMGMFLDGDANQARYGKEVRITTPESKVQAWVVPTDEELEIARQTSEVVG